MKLFSFCLLLLDIVSKIVANSYIPSQGITLFEGVISFSLDLAYNTGAAWGVFAGHAKLLFFCRLIILAILIFTLLKEKKNRTVFLVLLSGAIGNMLDYLFYGHVIDFLHFRFWGHSFPIFNFADSYITCSLLFLLLFQKRLKKVDA